MKELGDGCWHASPKPPDAQRAGGIKNDQNINMNINDNVGKRFKKLTPPPSKMVWLTVKQIGSS